MMNRCKYSSFQADNVPALESVHPEGVDDACTQRERSVSLLIGFCRACRPLAQHIVTLT